MRRLLIACALLLWGGMLSAQEFIRYYPPQSNSAGNGFLGTSGGSQLQWDAANFLAQRNSTAVQEFRVYGTYIDASNYHRLVVGRYDGSNYSLIYAEKAGSPGIAALALGSSSGIVQFGDTTGRQYNADATSLNSQVNNAQDLGVSAARFRTLYLGTSEVLSLSTGEAQTKGVATELLTLSTGAATTDTTANLLPANSLIDSVVVRVTTGITTAVSFTVGDATTGARFATGVAAAAGTTSVGLLHKNPDVAAAAGPVQTTAAKVRITCNTTPGAGIVRITVFYRTFAPPSS
jgi:hypothetical protein